MKKYAFWPLLTLLGGIAAFGLRLMQNRTGFEAETGLPVSGNPFALALPILLVVLALLFFLLSRNLPAGKGEGGFTDRFRSSGALLPTLLALGIFLWILAGAGEIFSGFVSAQTADTALSAAGLGYASSAISPRVTALLGLLTAVSATCLLPAVSCLRHAKQALNGNLLLAPVACLVIRLVLTYREDSVNPSLSAYYPELLALIFLILTLYRVSSFAFRDGRTRRFAFCAGMAVVFCLVTLADDHTLPAMLLYGGGAVLALAFLLLRLEGLATARGHAESTSRDDDPDLPDSEPSDQ